jgi:uncharacterized protein (TIGR02301 family)
MRRFSLALIMLLGILAFVPAVHAQQAAEEAEQIERPPPGPPPIYEKELLRLSEVIGALAFLRELCDASDAAQWPERMQALLDSEGPARAERLAGAYNRGYGAFALTYRVCTPSAELAIARYLDEGDRLSRLIASRYGT